MSTHLFQGLRDVFGSFSKRGVVPTLSLLLPEVLFDRRYGTDTFQIVTAEELADVTSPSKALGRHYQGANPKIFMRIFKDVQKRFSRDFSKEVFIDFGCGKGRALLMAALSGFRKSIGVEYSPSLCAIAEKNIETFLKRTKSGTQFEVIRADALTYSIPDEATMFFFFDPFKRELIERVLERIHQSVMRSPRAALVVYMNPRSPEAFSPDKFRRAFSVGEGQNVPDAHVFEFVSG